MKFHTNENGTVPVKFHHFYGGYGSGEIAAFAADHSKNLVETLKRAVYVDKDGNEIKQAAPKTVEPEETVDLTGSGDVVIPDDWKKKHHLIRIKYASTISGEQVKTADEADAIITAELERRKAS